MGQTFLKRPSEAYRQLIGLGEIDEDPAQMELLQLGSPMLTTAEFQAMRKYMGDGAGDIDCTFDVAGGENALREAIARMTGPITLT